MTAETYTEKAMALLPMQQLQPHAGLHIRRCLLSLFRECLGCRKEKEEGEDNAV